MYRDAVTEAGGHSDEFEVNLFGKIKEHVEGVGDLVGQMDQMRQAPWMRTDADGRPEIIPNNARNYSLSPYLRVLDERAGSFHGAFSNIPEAPFV